MADMASVYTITGVDNLSGPAGTAEASLGRLEAAGSRAGSVLATALGAAAIGGVVALGAALAGTVTTAANFEQQISAIGAVANATGAEMDALRATALQLGKDTSFSALEAAKGMEELVKAGVSVADVIGGAGAAALNLAAAGGLSVAEAATIASNAMNVFSKSGADMGHVADVIAGAANASAIDVHQFGFSLSAVGAVAATMGVSLEDTATSIAVLGQAGLKGSDAGTSLKTMLLNLDPASKAARAELTTLGIITADGSNKFFDAAGNIKSMSDIAEILQTSMQGLTKEQQINALQTAFGTDAIRAAAIMAKAGAAGFNEMAASIGKISAADVAAARLDNFKGSMEKLRGSVETASIIIGSMFLPALKDVADAATDMVNTVIPMLEAIPDAWRTIGQVFANDWQPDEAIGPFINAVGNAAVIVRDTFLPTIRVAWGWIQDHSDALIGALSGVGVALAGIVSADIATAAIGALGGALAALLTPIGLVVTAGAVLGAAWATDWGGIQEITQNFVNWFWDVAAPGIIAAGDTVAAWITGTLIPAFEQFGGWLQPQLVGAWTWLTATALPGIVVAGAAAVQWMTDTAVPALALFGQWLQPRITAAWTWFTGTALPAIGPAVQAAAGFITTTAIPALTEFVQWLQPKIEAAWSWFTGTAMPAVGTAVGAVAGFITTTAIPALADLAQALQPRLQAAADWFSATAMPAIVAAASAVATGIAGLVTWFGDLNTALVDRQVYDDITTAFTNIGVAAGVLGPLLFPTLAGNIDKSGASAGAASPLLNTVADAIKVISSTIAEASANLAAFAQFFVDIANKIRDAQNALREWVGMIPGATTPIPGLGIPIVSPGRIPPVELPSASQTPAEGPIFGPPVPPSAPAAAQGPVAAASPLARQTPWTEAQVRSIQQRIMGGEMPSPPAYDPSKSLNERMQAWAPTLNWLEANTGFKASNLAGLIAAENNFGASELSAQGNNYFSITRSPYDALADPGTSRFPTYPSAEANIARTVGLLAHPENTNYGPAFANRGNDPGAFTNSLSAGGWIVNEPGFPISTWQNNVAAGAGRYQNVVGGAPPSSEPAVASAGRVNAGIPFQGQNAPIRNQWAMGLPYDQAAAACGPAAVALFMEASGRTPNAAEVVRIAALNGWKPSEGMGGVGAFMGTLSDLSVNAALLAPTGAAAAESVQSGHTTAISTGMHFQVAQGYDPATGMFDLGATGGPDPTTGAKGALTGGSRFMTAQQIIDMQGPINGVIQLLGEVPPAAATASASVDTFDASVTTIADAVTPATDAIAALSTDGADSLATLAADGSASLMTLQTDGSASTAALSTNVQADMSAMQAGATADVAAMDEAVVASVDDMQTTVTTASGSMATGVATNATTMASDVQASAASMAADATAAATQMATDASAAATQMADDVTTQAALMTAQVILEATGMGTGVADAATAMQETASTEADTMNTNVAGSISTMQADSSTSLQTLSEDATAAFGDAGDAATGVVDPLDASAASFKITAGAARSAVKPLADVASAAASIKPVNMGDTVRNLTAVQHAATSAATALTKLGEAGKSVGTEHGSSSGSPLGGSKSEGGSGGGKAAGGPVMGGTPYLVGEIGPEIFVPSTSGTIMTHDQVLALMQTAHSSGVESAGGAVIDYDRLAAAIQSAASAKNYNLTVNTNAPYEPIVQDFRILEAQSASNI